MRQQSGTHTITLITLPRVMIFLGVMALVCGVGMGRRNLTMLGSGMFSVILVAYLSAPNLRRIKAVRGHLDHTFEGEALRIQLDLSRPGESAAPLLLEVYDYMPASDRRHIHALLPRAFEGGRGLTLRYRPRIQDKRGLYVLGPVRLGSSDPLGLVPCAASLPIHTKLLVYPNASILDDFKPFHTHAVRHMGEHSIPREGVSQEFLLAREYQHGDSPRLVHWPMSIRHGKLHVKAFEDNTMTEVTLLLDLFQISHTGIGNITSVEALVAATASLATLAIEQCHLVRLLALSGLPTTIPLGAGSRHLYEILNALTLVRSEGKGSLVDAARASLPALTPGGTVVFVMAATSVEEDLDGLIAELQARRLRIAAVLIDDRTYPTLYLDQQLRAAKTASTDEIAARIAGLGVEVTILAKGEDVREKLELSA